MWVASTSRWMSRVNRVFFLFCSILQVACWVCSQFRNFNFVDQLNRHTNWNAKCARLFPIFAQVTLFNDSNVWLSAKLLEHNMPNNVHCTTFKLFTFIAISTEKKNGNDTQSDYSIYKLYCIAVFILFERFITICSFIHTTFDGGKLPKQTEQMSTVRWNKKVIRCRSIKASLQ